MPEMPEAQLKRLRTLAEQFAHSRRGNIGSDLGSGGSAAVFKYTHGKNVFAIKVYEPSFFDEKDGPAERHRIDLQRKLIGHGCVSLVEIIGIDYEFDTCFITMEFVEGVELSKCLDRIPRESIFGLICQLSVALRYLYDINLVHRDIKPHNVMVSGDFQKLTLIDLGVVREVDSKEDYDGTDHGGRKPFIATAQYSSPEYLFRLIEPCAELWLGLTFYQIGGVLHDLIARQPLFFDQIKSENRYVVAMAVLRTMPLFDSITDVDVGLKSLAMRCLTKDLSHRLNVVNWNDFQPKLSSRDKLRNRLGAISSTDTVGIELEKSKVLLARRNCFASLVREFKLQLHEEYDEVLCEEISVNIPQDSALILIKLQKLGLTVGLSLRIDWRDEDHKGILLSKAILHNDNVPVHFFDPNKEIIEIDINVPNDPNAVHELKNTTADALVKAMDCHASGEMPEQGVL